MWKLQCQREVNKQINLEFWASYQYHFIWSHFNRNSVGLENVANYFKKASDEEREHAHKLMEYQNMRGGSVELVDITNVDLRYLNQKAREGLPNENDVLASFRKALEMEIIVYDSLLELHKVADDNNDPQFADFIEGEYLEEQVKAISEIEKYISQLERIGDNGHGVWDFDRNLGSD